MKRKDEIFLRNNTAQAYKHMRSVLRAENPEPLDKNPQGFAWWKVILLLAVFSCLLWLLSGHAWASEGIKQDNIAGRSLNQWTNAIKRTEGDKFYGIKSIKVTNEPQALRICRNTVRNNYRRFVASGGNRNDLKAYIYYIADRYCPKSAD